jgi:hypothetical protein
MHIIPARPEHFGKEKDENEYHDNFFNINENSNTKFSFFFYLFDYKISNPDLQSTQGQSPGYHKG